MGCDNISIFDILVIKRAELPVGFLLPFRVLVVGHLAEYRHLFDQALQSTDMDGEAGLVGGIFNALLLILTKLVNPNGNNLLQLGTGQVTEGCVFAS